jgi:type IV pilus assembly protein PilF
MMRRTGLLLVLAASLLGACASSGPSSSDARTDGSSMPEASDPERRAQVRLELASAYFSRGQLATALDEVNLALQARPDMPHAYNLRGLIQSANGDDKLAEESFRRALQLNPRDGDTMHNYGWLLCQQNRHADADAQFTQALALPRYVNAPRTLMAQGICLARAGQNEPAELALSRSYELDPGNPVTAVNLAEVLFRRGEYERARFYIRRVNGQAELSSAQTLWLATRIEHKLNNASGVADFGKQLRDRFPNSREASSLARGQFNE